MSYYNKHLFFCCNQREGGKKCCNNADACSVRAYAKERLQALGLHGRGQVRVNQAGCMGRCQQGPVLVVYPDEVWYTYQSTADIDEIIERHIRQGEIVQRLLIPAES